MNPGLIFLLELHPNGIKLLAYTRVKQKYMQIMARASLFIRFANWLKSPEVFGSITKKIPGSWQLYEYYVDLKEDLIHLRETDLKNNNELLQIEFGEDEQFSLNEQLPLPVFKQLQEGQWSVHRNFITLVDPKNFRNNIEFQFAFQKNDLKLLKKDRTGKIEFFGFFRLPQSEKAK